MIRGLSFIIACIITALLVCLLYPIAVVFWFLGRIGYVVGLVSNWIFTHTNNIIGRLWSELRNPQNPTE